MAAPTLFSVVLFLATVTAATASTYQSTNRTNSAAPSSDTLLQELLQWIASARDAYVSPKIDISSTATEHSLSGGFGVFATHAIAAGEIVFTVPWHLIVRPLSRQTGSTHPSSFDNDCEIVDSVYRQLRKAATEPSNATPYARYLLQTATANGFFLPSLWSKPGKELLDRLTADTLIPMHHHVESQFRRNYLHACAIRHVNNLRRHAWQLVVSRADDDLMVPLYDMLNHDNRQTNTVHRVEAASFSIVASVDIAAGHQLYTSYNQCSICGGRHWHYGTPELFRDYGFVEQGYPKRFVLMEDNLIFDVVDEGRQVLYHRTPNDFQQYVQDELEHLLRFGKIRHSRNASSVPEREWDSIWALYDAYLEAFSLLSIPATPQSAISSS